MNAAQAILQILSDNRTGGTSPGSAPDYSSLNNLELYVDYTGLVSNTNNSYGVVDGSGNVTSLKSVAPSTLGRDFASNGTAPTLTAAGIVFGGAGRLRHTTAATWNFLHYNATLVNLKWTVHAVVKFGTGANPDAAYGLLGNNGSSSANKGAAIFFDDRVSQTRNNGFRGLVTQGGTNVSVTGTQDNIITPNTFLVLTVETEFSVTSAYTQRVYINGKLQGVNIVYAAPAMVTTPTYDLEIGGVGNSVLPAVMTLKELTIQSTISTGEVRDAFINALITKHAISVPVVTSTVATAQTLGIFNVYQETATKYYLNSGYDQHPLKPWIVLRYWFDGEGHYGADDPTKKISLQRSVNYGVTLSAREDLFDPVGASIVSDFCGGYLSSGRHVIMLDQHEAPGGDPFDPTFPPRLIKIIYTDDNYLTKTVSDLSTLIPNDGLSTFRIHGNLIENNGYVMTTMYKFTDELIFTESANYLIRASVNSNLSDPASWSVITIRTKGSASLNEMTLLGLSSTHVVCIIRSEDTKEWVQFMSDDNGLTWTNQGDLTLGETLGEACPGMLSKFKIDNTEVAGFHYTDRNNSIYKAVFGTIPAIISGGVAGWIVASKTTFISGTNRQAVYGTPMRPTGNFNAILSSAYERNPRDLSANDIILAVLPSTNYATVKTALGL